MAPFHSEENIDFLQRVTHPKLQTETKSLPHFNVGAAGNIPSLFMFLFSMFALLQIVWCSRACTSSAPSTPELPSKQ
jgi:hypothetical protein